MAVSRAQPEQIKSTPDVAKLQGFSSHMVTVTKHRAPRGTVGNPVVPTQRMSLTDILALTTSLPLSYGPGFYRFEVVDQGGTGSDVFMQQLGGDVPYDTQEAPMAVLPGGTSNGAVPSGPDIVHLGNGFYYNMTMKLLTTPWREIVPWEEGQPMPKQPPSPSAQANQFNPFMQGAATPWNPNMWSPPGSGWGSFPVNDDSVKVKELQARLDDEKRQREMQALRDEVKANNAAVSAAIEKLALALTAKPAGPSETEQMLKRELEEEKRRREQTEREDRIRAEMRMQQERFEAQIAAITANKTDPMMPMLLQLIASVQQNASETVKSIQAATQTGMQASERSTQQMLAQLSGSVMSPLQLMELMRSARGDAGQAASAVIDAAKEAMSMQKEVFTNLLELSSQGDQPAWLQAVRELSGTVVGPLGNMLAQRQQQQQQVAAPPPRRQMPPQQMRQPPAAGMAGAPMAVQPPALPAARASDAAHHQRTHVAPTQVEDTRARAAASIAHFQQPPTSPGAQGADVTLASGSGVVAAPVHGEVMAGAAGGSVTPIAAAPKKRGRGKKNAAPVAEPAPAPPVQGFTMDQMRDADPDVLREMVALLNDEQLFGMTLAYVEQLRASDDPPEKLAESILSSRQYITSLGGVIPPGMELLIAQQTVVLVERLLPDATEELRAAVVEEIDAALEIENGGADDDDEEEDEEEGDEADAN